MKINEDEVFKFLCDSADEKIKFNGKWHIGKLDVIKLVEELNSMRCGNCKFATPENQYKIWCVHLQSSFSSEFGCKTFKETED